MVDQAIKSAEHLVLEGSDRLSLGGSDTGVVASKGPVYFWTDQSSGAFFGEASHKDRVAGGSAAAGEL